MWPMAPWLSATRLIIGQSEIARKKTGFSSSWPIAPMAYSHAFRRLVRMRELDLLRMHHLAFLWAIFVKPVFIHLVYVKIVSVFSLATYHLIILSKVQTNLPTWYYVYGKNAVWPVLNMHLYALIWHTPPLWFSWPYFTVGTRIDCSIFLPHLVLAPHLLIVA